MVLETSESFAEVGLSNTPKNQTADTMISIRLLGVNARVRFGCFLFFQMSFWLSVVFLTV